MKNEHWEAIQLVFEKMEQAVGQLVSAPSRSQPAVQPPESDGETSTKAASPAADQCYDVVAVRSEIRTRLDFLRVKLAETLTERDCYLVLFPIVAYFDEHVKTCYLDENQLSWPPLQKELFQIDDAGELFYETVDDLLRKPQTIPFIYEVYYFCLNQGFHGKYVDNPVKISEYMKKLRAKIPVVDMSNAQRAAAETGQVKLVGSAAWYYLASAAALVLCYLLLLAFSHFWDVGFVSEEVGRSRLSQLQQSVRAERVVLPRPRGSVRKSINKRRTMMVRPIRHIIEESHVAREQGSTASLKRKLETPSQSFEEKEVAPAADRENLGRYSRQLRYIYSVQVSSFKFRKTAFTHLQELQGRGLDTWLDLDTRGGYHRVLVGKYEGRNEALALLSRLKESKEFADALQVKVEMEVSPSEPEETLPQYFGKLRYIYSVQVGSYRYKKGALTHLQELQVRGLDAWLDLDTRGGYHRVLVGKYKGRREALAMLSRLKESEEFGDALQVKVETGGFSKSAEGV